MEFNIISKLVYSNVIARNLINKGESVETASPGYTHTEMAEQAAEGLSAACPIVLPLLNRLRTISFKVRNELIKSKGKQ